MAKRIIVALLLFTFLVAPANAQVVDHEQYQSLLRQIIELQKQVVALLLQLIELRQQGEMVNPNQIQPNTPESQPEIGNTAPEKEKEKKAETRVFCHIRQTDDGIWRSGTYKFKDWNGVKKAKNKYRDCEEIEIQLPDGNDDYIEDIGEPS